MDRSTWKTSLLRWIAWFILCAGMGFGMFLIRDLIVLSLSRALARQGIQREQTGRLINVTQLESWADFSTILIMLLVSFITIALVVSLDYYLRDGERKGRLFQHIGKAVGIELGVYGLTLLVQYALTAFG